jgi:hypothetical protein
MKRLALPAAVLGVLLLAACGDQPADGGAESPQESEKSAEESEKSAEEAEYARAALDRHDEKWPEIGAACAEEPAAEADGRNDADGEDGQDGPQPENPRHAENDAYRQTMNVPPAERCRGEAHAARIASAMAEEEGVFGDADQTRELLERLGYGPDGITAKPAGTGVASWDISVSGAGPCISGFTGEPDRITVHGMYLEGGCTKPKGGH